MAPTQQTTHFQQEALVPEFPETQRMLLKGTGDKDNEKYDKQVFSRPENAEREELYADENLHTDVTHIEHGRCGIGQCTPKWAQKFASLPLFVITYGVAGLWMSAQGPMLGSQITSIERHLGLSTSNTGLILSANDIGYLFAVVVGSYLGKHMHIPRTLCFSAVIFGLTSVVMALGKLTEVRAELVIGQNSSSSEENSQQQYLCSPSTTWGMNSSSWDASSSNATKLDGFPNNESNSVSSSPALTWAFWLMIVAAVVGGVVKSYRLPLFTYYVESNVKDSSSSALLLGTSFSAMVFGPPLAILIGAYVSSLHVDLKETNMSQLDQRWVGAWWMGFLVVGVACIVSALPVMCFPRHLIQQDSKKPKSVKKNSTRQMIADLFSSLKRILKRPLYVLTLFTGVVEAFIGSGAFAFSQKYMEVQFNKSPQQVSMAIGIPIIFTLASGTFLGGLITTRLKMGLRGCIIAGLLRSSALLAIQCLYFVFGCNNTQFAEPTPSLDSCQCDPESLLFVCGDNQVNYLSPCVAGCTNITQNVFTNCSGIESGLQQVRPGLCDDGCPYFIYFVATGCFLAFLSCLGIIPGYIQIVRTVDKTDQAIAMGASAFCATLLGTLPSPVVFGKIIDSTCQIWSPVGGYCLLYDKESFRFWFFGVGQIIRIGHVILISVLLWLVVIKKIGSANTENEKE
ncbi:hypothetical protein RRG08_000573 [Elysia crispata]|uniref:Solute carrier organic anion transporter family member n=1 Tax=Elysia crispata TaxID=231223 RepID=A0AAE1CUS3_9GAST|nr:hypothetical protein RRG08_000573 [Elysia crispata]